MGREEQAAAAGDYFLVDFEGESVIVARDAGHINAESGHGEWTEGLRWLSALRRAAQWPVGSRRPFLPALIPTEA